MKGFSGYTAESEGEPVGKLAEWESLVVEATGNVIEFWGFKRNQGRVWGLLYLRGRALSAGEVQDELGLSKGAVSMLTRELEGWGVIRRVRAAGDSGWRFQAETNLVKMIGRVIEQREGTLLARVRADLDRACELAEAEDVSADVRERLDRVRTLAVLVEEAVKLFLQTSRLDAKKALSALDRAGKWRRKR